MRVCFDLGDVFHPGASDEDNALSLQALLECLIAINRVYLRHHSRTPKLYQSGVRYGRTQVWDSIPDLLTRRYGDCFPVGSLLLRDDFELISIEDARIGDRIWGHDAWTTIKAHVYKGILSVDALVLNNGSRVLLTGDHHVFLARCSRHVDREAANGYGCSCPVEDRVVERVRLRDARAKDVVLAPRRLPFGARALDPDRAYVEGLYVADGWSENSRFCISGQDGCPKEEQKREVVRICDRLGLHTRWHRKYVAVNDGGWALRMQQMGGHAPDKHILSIDLDEATAAATLRGVMADGTRREGGGWAFTTTSKRLAIQVRLLHKMFARACASIATVQPGIYDSSFTKSPVWGIGVRDPQAKADKLLRVKRVERDLVEAPCYDIETSDGYVYLPEYDVTVSNCKSLVAMHVAERREAGEHVKPVFRFAKNPQTGTKDFHILEWYGGKKFEDPSRKLGMEQYHHSQGLWLFPQ